MKTKVTLEIEEESLKELNKVLSEMNPDRKGKTFEDNAEFVVGIIVDQMLNLANKKEGK